MMKRKFFPSIWPRRGVKDGSAAVEFAIILFPLILLALGTFDYFAATYQITTLSGAARTVAEMARNDPQCVGNATSTNCTANLYSLISSMSTNNNSLSGLTCCTSSTTSVVSSAADIASPVYYYSCAGQIAQNGAPYQNLLSTNSSLDCSAYAPDTRVVQYVQVFIKKGWWQLFSWDPWSSANPLKASMILRTQ